jgi:putative MATE family efflux protein
MDSEMKLLNGKASRHFARYVSFNMLSMLGLSLYVLADTYFIANKVGSGGLTALNLVLPVYSLLNGLGLMLGMGGATRYSVYLGEGECKRGCAIFTKVFMIGVILGIAFTLGGVFFSDPLVRLLGAAEEIAPLAALYIRTILCFSLVFLLNNLFICFVRNDGAPQLSMAAMLTASISNIVLDYLLVYPLDMGMFGAALATGLSPVISLSVLSLHKIRGKNRLHIQKTPVRGREIGQVIAAGIPSFVTEFSAGVVMLIFNFALLRMSGNTAVAAYGIITNIALVCMALFNGIGQGIQPIVSVYYGAGRRESAANIYRYACVTALAFGLLFLAVGQLFPQQITAVFNGEDDPCLAEMAVRGIRFYFFAFLFMGFNIVTTSYFACVSQAKRAFVISLVRGIVAVVPVLCMLSLLFGMDGIWASMPVAEWLTALISIYFLICYKKEIRMGTLNI